MPEIRLRASIRSRGCWPATPRTLACVDYEVRRARVREVDIAYWREGVGGFSLLLLHGWPETKRIWARNVMPLAEAGFDVIVPDMRGFGDSGLAEDGFYDVA